MTKEEMSKELKVSVSTLNREFKTLARSEMIKRFGSNKSGFWEVQQGWRETSDLLE